MDSKLQIENYTNYFTKIWEECREFTPGWKTIYPREVKKAREKSFEKFIEALNKRSNKKELNSKPAEKLTPVARSLFKTVFDYRDEQLDIILSEGYKKMTKDFIRMSRQFDPGLTLEDMFQACRNAWIMNGMQIMMGHLVELTPSIFAYSMLYPYTDNYLDDPGITAEGKIGFNKRFRKRLEGVDVPGKNENETAIFRLVGMIENQYNRMQFPKVYQGLLAIHDAQSRSLCLLGGKYKLTEKDILNICIEKGGASVLADGYLVAGDLTGEQALFFFGFGAYLQLVDDLQDVAEDSCAGQMTVFSKTAGQQPLDDFAVRLFGFGNRIFETMNHFPGDKVPVFRSLMKKSVETMLIETILLNGQYYSRPFLETIENQSPLSIAYLKKRRSKLSPNRISFIKKIVESAMAEL